jgi:hypothetical protein
LNHDIVVTGLKVFFQETVIVEKNPVVIESVRVEKPNIEEQDGIHDTPAHHKNQEQRKDQLSFLPSGFVVVS